MGFLELTNVSKSYGEGIDKTEVLKDLNLSIDEREFVAIVGFSGSGKTTLISLVAGLETPDSGAAELKGEPINEPGPDRGVVFQSYSLMPWLSVFGNISLAVDAVHKDKSKNSRKAIVDRYIEMVGLTHASDRRPSELSGGMRQRVAVARSLAMSPDILLLDEPLSALDALTRAKLQSELERIWAEDKKTVLLITNDVDEAILLADRIIPLTLAPNATLGPVFKVDLARPRNRTEMDSDPAFKKLRVEITNYLIGIGEKREQAAEGAVKLPSAEPIRLDSDSLPKAYQEAAKSAITRGYVEFFNLKKVYPTPTGPLTVVDGFDLKMERGEFISVIGHSGCGKSIVLSMTAGLTDVSDGGIVVDGREIYRAGPDRAVVFQAPSLMPWLSARQNVCLGVDRVYPNISDAERAEIAEYYLSRVGLGDTMDKSAAEMSNGMRQRVGIARAFALSPKLLLLDEPFGMLDSLTRWELQEVLMDVWKRTQVTALCVTHDVDEAILLADRVVMMTNGPNATIGNIIEVDLPRPRSRAQLLKHPKYYEYRTELLEFLEAYEGGRNPDPEVLAERTKKTSERAKDAA